MDKPECGKVAIENLDAGGYVCQGQTILRGTAEYKLDLDTQNKLATNAKATADEIKGMMKTAIETQSDQGVDEREGRLLAGASLKYGISMNPTCLAPANAHFKRILPQTMFGRVVNFVLFNIVEPMLPAKADRSVVAQNTHAAE
jgi:hypothetical protein